MADVVLILGSACMDTVLNHLLRPQPASVPFPLLQWPSVAALLNNSLAFWVHLVGFLAGTRRNRSQLAHKSTLISTRGLIPTAPILILG